MSRASQGLLQREDCVLVVIDVQERLLPLIAGGEAVVSAIEKALKFARIMEIPIIWLEQHNLGATAASVREQLDGEEPLRKLEFSCMGSEDFRRQLAQLGRKTLVLVGIETHICVALTALEAVPEYDVQVVADATSARSLEFHQIAVERLRQAGVTVTCLEMLMYELLRKAGTDRFRAVLPLVK